MTIEEFNQLQNPTLKTQIVEDYVARNKANYDKPAEELITMFANQMIINFEAYLTQTEPLETLKGNKMMDVLGELYFEAKCLKKVLDERA